MARLHPSLYGERRLHEVGGERWVAFGGVRFILPDDGRGRVAPDAFASRIEDFRFESGTAVFRDALGTFAWSRGFLGRLERGAREGGPWLWYEDREGNSFVSNGGPPEPFPVPARTRTVVLSSRNVARAGTRDGFLHRTLDGGATEFLHGLVVEDGRPFFAIASPDRRSLDLYDLADNGPAVRRRPAKIEPPLRLCREDDRAHPLLFGPHRFADLVWPGEAHGMANAFAIRASSTESCLEWVEALFDGGHAHLCSDRPADDGGHALRYVRRRAGELRVLRARPGAAALGARDERSGPARRLHAEGRGACARSGQRV